MAFRQISLVLLAKTGRKRTQVHLFWGQPPTISAARTSIARCCFDNIRHADASGRKNSSYWSIRISGMPNGDVGPLDWHSRPFERRQNLLMNPVRPPHALDHGKQPDVIDNRLAAASIQPRIAPAPHHERAAKRELARATAAGVGLPVADGQNVAKPTVGPAKSVKLSTAGRPRSMLVVWKRPSNDPGGATCASA